MGTDFANINGNAGFAINITGTRDAVIPTITHNIDFRGRTTYTFGTDENQINLIFAAEKILSTMDDVNLDLFALDAGSGRIVGFDSVKFMCVKNTGTATIHIGSPTGTTWPGQSITNGLDVLLPPGASWGFDQPNHGVPVFSAGSIIEIANFDQTDPQTATYQIYIGGISN